MTSPTLRAGLPAVPDMNVVGERYRDFNRALDRGSPAAAHATLREWDELRRELSTWSRLTKLRFTQDTRDERGRAARAHCDEVAAVLTGYDTTVKARLVAADTRPDMESAVGRHVFRLWDNDLATYDPQIEADLITEAQLQSDYTSLMAGIEVSFAGERHNLPSLQRFASDPDRDRRAAAAAARWAALGECGDELDALFDRLVHVRDAIARKLGFADFTPLGYARMRRVDYDRAAVERYRDAVATHVVPFANELAQRARARLGVEQFSLWDEKFLGAYAPPRPRGDAAWIMDRTVDGFAEIDPALGAFAHMMRERELTDLVARPGKAGGGYCTSFPTIGVPFIFTNFNETPGDITVLMHELGHAFQSYRSRELPVIDYFTPTYEAAEVHSMSLEFLSWPLMERFFGDGADAYRHNHLAESIAFIPYGVAVDHFQHLVYGRPDATSAERHAMWRAVERRYLPWRAYGDLARPAAGAFWQSQQHIYTSPFYYIDYTLALCCALQMWVQAGDDAAGTLARYVALCSRGGAAPFRTLMADARISEPFHPGALSGVVARARAFLSN